MLRRRSLNHMITIAIKFGVRDKNINTQNIKNNNRQNEYMDTRKKCVLYTRILNTSFEL
jgi:hypothetical protein